MAFVSTRCGARRDTRAGPPDRDDELHDPIRLLPLALFGGSDANLWNAFAFTPIGGLISSTLLVLNVPPTLYMPFDGGQVP